MIVITEKGSLTRLGYSSKEPAVKRHAALRRAVLMYSAGAVIRKLNAIRVLNRIRRPEISRVYEDDMRWVQNL